MRFTTLLLAILCSPVTPVSAAGATDTNVVVKVVRGFLSAAMTMEMEEVKRFALPHPEIGILGEGMKPPARVKRHMRAVISRAACRFLQAGEVIRLPGGRKITIAKEAVSDRRCQVWPRLEGQPMPVPLAVVRTEAGWRVDATPLIAARIAANERRSGPDGAQR